jgi:hypothetical protein
MILTGGHECGTLLEWYWQGKNHSNWRKKLSQFYSDHQKSHVDWPGIELKPPHIQLKIHYSYYTACEKGRWQAVTAYLKLQSRVFCANSPLCSVQTVPCVLYKQSRVFCANSPVCSVQTVPCVLCKQSLVFCANSLVCSVQTALTGTNGLKCKTNVLKFWVWSVTPRNKTNNI